MSTDAIACARQYYQGYGRDVDRARYAYYFQQGSLDELLGVLAHYQNDDGGFGHFFAYVRTPETYMGRLLPASLLAERLDALAAEQAEDGGWPSPYAEHWRGWTTVQNLLVLRAFGRI